MEAAAIRQAMHTQPFRTFRQLLADGRASPVAYPDFIAVAANGRRVVVFNSANDALTILEPLLIVSLEYSATAQGPTPPTENGV
jgi:hypothetical protein